MGLSVILLPTARKWQIQIRRATGGLPLCPLPCQPPRLSAVPWSTSVQCLQGQNLTEHIEEWSFKREAWSYLRVQRRSWEEWH